MSNELIKTAAFVLIAAALIITLRSHQLEFAFLATLAVIAAVTALSLSKLWSAFSQLRTLFEQSGNAGAYFETALKALGIAYIAGFAADVCRDFGLGALANTTETVGKVTVFVLSIPLATAVMEAALKFVGI